MDFFETLKISISCLNVQEEKMLSQRGSDREREGETNK